MKTQPNASAKVLDIKVFAKPGKSSNKILPLARTPAITISIVCSLPNTTLDTSSVIDLAALFASSIDIVSFLLNFTTHSVF